MRATTLVRVRKTRPQPLRLMCLRGPGDCSATMDDRTENPTLKVALSPHPAVRTLPPGERHELTVQGVRTRYWTYGPDRARWTILMVHGFRGDHHGLEPVIAHLRGYRVVAPDLPGFGQSAPFVDRTHSVAGYADWLTAFVAQLPEAPEVVLGHSFGSVVVAAAVAQGLPARRVVLVNPVGAPALSGPRAVLSRLALLYYRLGAALPERPGSALLRSTAVVRVMSAVLAKSRLRPMRAWILAEHLRYFSVFADRRMVGEAFAASVGDDISTYAARVSVPVLLVGGDRDDITPVEVHQRLVSLFPTAELAMIAGVGHLIHYETPDQAAQIIQDFLDADG
jgi:pimeloyl-ACP methyl ester carboxylesterase